jgi:serine/threonine protein kinase
MRWMSPELLDSETQVHRRTKHSDCCALGMVIYEILTRRVPFYRYTNFVVFGKVIKGERLERPLGPEGATGLTDDARKAPELC